MAIDTTQFQAFSYIARSGVDKYLVEDYLLPGLAVQSRLGKASRGIPLPTPFGKPQEFIPLEDAAGLVLSWLEDTNNLYSKDKAQLIKLLHKVSYEQFANIASEIYQTRVEDPNKLFTAARLQNLAEYRAAQKSSASTPAPKFDPGKTIDDYNTLYSQLLRYANTGASPTLFQQILPAGVPVGSGDLSKQVLSQIILQNITELRGAAHAHRGDERSAHLAVSQKLEKIIRNSYPEQSAYLNLLGDQQISEGLDKYTQNIEQQLLDDGLSLQKIDDSKLRALASSEDTIATEYEIYQQIQHLVPLTSDAEKKIFAKALIQTISATANRQLTGDEIIELALSRIHADTTQLQAIKAELHKSGLVFAIEYRQNELAVIVDSHHLTLGERNLLRRGINPFKTSRSEVDLTIKKDKLLKEFQIDSGTKFTSIEEAHTFEQGRNNPDINWIRRFRAHEDQLGAYSFLEFNEKSLINRTRFGRWVTDARSRLYNLQDKFFNKWIDLEETITGRKYINKLFDRWDKFAEGVTVKFGKTQIPIFRLVPWVYDRIDEWKKLTTLKALSTTAKWKGPLGKFIHWSLEQYKLGDHTVSGATYQVFRSAWGAGTKWVLKKSVVLATKLGLGSAFKYATVSASRTAIRLLLQMGGKALAKLGIKAIAALVAAGTAIGTAFSAVLAVLMIFDLVKLAWNFVKNFLTNGEFRKTVIKWGAAIAAFFGAINFASIGVAIGLIFAWTLQTLLLSFIIVGIMMASITFISRAFNTTIHLDSGVSTLLATSTTTIDCFVFEATGQQFPKNDASTGSEPTEGWSSGDLDAMKSVIEKIKSTYGNFIEAVCRGGDIHLWRDSSAPSVTWGGWAMTGNDLRIYNNGVSAALYTLSHELGHIYATRIGGIADFITQKLVFWNPVNQTCEKNIYPAQPTSEGMCYGENFAEGISWKISGHGSLPSTWAQWVITNIFGGK